MRLADLWFLDERERVELKRLCKKKKEERKRFKSGLEEEGNILVQLDYFPMLASINRLYSV